MAKKKDILSQFERDLLASIKQSIRGEGSTTTSEQIAKRASGRPVQAVHKQPVTLRLDPAVVAAWRATGKGWQTRAAQTLARAAARL